MRRLTYIIGACCTFIFAASFAEDGMKGTTGEKGSTGEIGMRGASGMSDLKGGSGPKRHRAIGMNDTAGGEKDEDVIDDTDVYAIPLDKSADSEEADMAKLKQMQKQQQEKAAQKQQQNQAK